MGSNQGEGGPLASIELEHAIGFTGSIAGSLSLLPNGEEILYVSGACLVIASLADPHAQTFLRGHTEAISCVHVSQDGRLAASGQRGRVADVYVWDLSARRQLYRLQEHDAVLRGGISSVAFTEDARFLLTTGVVPEDKKLMVWDMHNGYIVAQSERALHTTCAVFGGRVKDVKRRPTMHPQFVTAGPDGLKYWDLDPLNGLTSEPCLTSNQKRVYTCVAFSAAEDLLFAGTLTGDFCVLNVPRRLSSGELERINLRLTVLVCSGGIHSMSVSGRDFFVGGGDGSVTLYDTDYDEGYKPRKVADGLSGAVTAIAVSAERGTAVFGTAASAIYEHNLSDPRARPRMVAENHGDRVVAVCYAPGDSVRFATVSEDLTIRVWNASDYSVETRCQTRNSGKPLALAFSGTAVFVGWEDGQIRAYDADEGVELWAIAECHRGGVSALCLSHNQRFIVSGGARGEVRVWELKTRTLVSHLVQHDDLVTSLALSDDDLLLYSSSKDKSFICWDLRQEKRLVSRTQSAGGINAIILLPAPTPEKQVYVMSVGQERKLTYWDMRQTDPLNLVPIGFEQLCVASTSNGNLVAVGGLDCVVRLFDTLEYTLLAECVGHSDSVLALKFSPDDRQLVSTGADGCVLVWNVYSSA
ncbi:WD40-repeat-containing domain protein [Pavlovales sp. CCMP2436]|nr:WD40-repeat-containing domain protein [Pavlovales sp. CCMP2436]|mmetsp:Transcript_45072/g.111726  ORF Transcript_45072/g.111726 Transcript_45072/m.111726 type:complete len:641 (-) Transcript_45072:152-2074(-)